MAGKDLVKLGETLNGTVKKNAQKDALNSLVDSIKSVYDKGNGWKQFVDMDIMSPVEDQTPYKKFWKTAYAQIILDSKGAIKLYTTNAIKTTTNDWAVLLKNFESTEGVTAQLAAGVEQMLSLATDVLTNLLGSVRKTQFKESASKKMEGLKSLAEDRMKSFATNALGPMASGVLGAVLGSVMDMGSGKRQDEKSTSFMDKMNGVKKTDEKKGATTAGGTTAGGTTAGGTTGGGTTGGITGGGTTGGITGGGTTGGITGGGTTGGIVSLGILESNTNKTNVLLGKMVTTGGTTSGKIDGGRRGSSFSPTGGTIENTLEKTGGSIAGGSIAGGSIENTLEKTGGSIAGGSIAGLESNTNKTNVLLEKMVIFFQKSMLGDKMSFKREQEQDSEDGKRENVKHNDMMKALSGIGGGVKGENDSNGGGMFSGMMDKGKDMLMGKLSLFKKMGPLLASGLTAAIGPALIIGGLVWAIKDGIAGFFKSDEWGVSKVSGAIGGFFGGTSSGIEGAFKNAGKWALIGAGIGSIVPVIGTIAGGIAGAAIGGILGFIGGEKIANALDSVGSWITEKWNVVIQGIKNIWNDIVSIFTKTFNFVSDFAIEGWTDLSTYITGIWNTVKTWITEKFNFVSDFVIEGWTNLPAYIGTVVGTVKKWFGDLFSFGSGEKAVATGINILTFWPGLIAKGVLALSSWFSGLLGFDSTSKELAKEGATFNIGTMVMGLVKKIKKWFGTFMNIDIGGIFSSIFGGGDDVAESKEKKPLTPESVAGNGLERLLYNTARTNEILESIATIIPDTMKLQVQALSGSVGGYLTTASTEKGELQSSNNSNSPNITDASANTTINNDNRKVAVIPNVTQAVLPQNGSKLHT